MEAYRSIHEWFTRTTNTGIQDRRTKVMMPASAPSESQIVRYIERWEREMREHNEATKEEPLSDAMVAFVIGVIALWVV